MPVWSLPWWCCCQGNQASRFRAVAMMLVAMPELAANLRVPDGFGVIVRRQAKGVDGAQLQASIDDLVTDWQANCVSYDPAIPARLYDGGSLSQRACRLVPRASYQNAI